MENLTVSIALIDSGINPDVSGLAESIEASWQVRFGNPILIEKTRHPVVTHQHGTAVALVIRHLCPEVRFNSITLLDSDLRADGRALIKACRKAVSLRPDIIHLSLGTVRTIYIPNFLIIRLSFPGTIVAAKKPGRGISLPSDIPGVIGVEENDSPEDFSISFPGKYAAKAPGWAYTVPETMELPNRYSRGSSIAAAWVTGRIAADLAAGRRYSDKTE